LRNYRREKECRNTIKEGGGKKKRKEREKWGDRDFACAAEFTDRLQAVRRVERKMKGKVEREEREKRGEAGKRRGIRR